MTGGTFNVHVQEQGTYITVCMCVCARVRICACVCVCVYAQVLETLKVQGVA